MLGGFLATGGLIAGIVTIGAGIVILVWPRIIAYIIGIYLILAGIFAIMAVLR